MADGYSVAKFMKIPDGNRRVKLICNVVVAGVPGAKPGDVLDVPHNVASELIDGKWAVEVLETQSASTVIQTREPQAENRDPQVQEESQKPPGKSSVRKPAK